MMNKRLPQVVVLFLLASTLAMASKNKTPKNDTPPDTTSLVTAINPGTSAGTATIVVADSAPFTVSGNTTIVIDGAPATLAQVKVGMQVLSETSADISAPQNRSQDRHRAQEEKEKQVQFHGVEIGRAAPAFAGAVEDSRR
jgi:hypothetical protein